MRYYVYIILYLSVMVPVYAGANIDDQLMGEWLGSPSKELDLVFIFGSDNSFKSKYIQGTKTYLLSGKYKLKEEDGLIYIDIYDLTSLNSKDKRGINGILKFIGANSFKFYGKKYFKTKSASYPKEFGRDTIVFKRQ